MTVMSLSDLEARVTALEKASPDNLWKTATKQEMRVARLTWEAGVDGAIQKRVRPDYYDFPLEDRQKFLSAPSKDHLCKTIIMENKNHDKALKNSRKSAKYVAVIVQYTKRLSAEKVGAVLNSFDGGRGTKKQYHMRLTDDETSLVLSGYGHNAVVPIGMNAEMPLLISHRIAELRPQFFWMGGGEVDLKLGCPFQEFVNAFNCHVVDVTDD